MSFYLISKKLLNQVRIKTLVYFVKIIEKNQSNNETNTVQNNSIFDNKIFNLKKSTHQSVNKATICF